jgi:hypothetical protein
MRRDQERGSYSPLTTAQGDDPRHDGAVVSDTEHRDFAAGEVAVAIEAHVAEDAVLDLDREEFSRNEGARTVGARWRPAGTSAACAEYAQVSVARLSDAARS